MQADAFYKFCYVENPSEYNDWLKRRQWKAAGIERKAPSETDWQVDLEWTLKFVSSFEKAWTSISKVEKKCQEAADNLWIFILFTDLR